MKSDIFVLQRFDADDGKVFDWVDLASHITVDEDGNETQEHLYAKTLYLAVGDEIENYIEVDAPTE